MRTFGNADEEDRVDAVLRAHTSDERAAKDVVRKSLVKGLEAWTKLARWTDQTLAVICDQPWTGDFARVPRSAGSMGGGKFASTSKGSAGRNSNLLDDILMAALAHDIVRFSFRHLHEHGVPCASFGKPSQMNP